MLLLYSCHITACTHTNEDNERKQVIEIHENLKLESKKFNSMLATEFSQIHYTDSSFSELEVIDGKFKE